MNKTAMWTIHAPGTCHDRPNQANRSNAGGNGSSATMMNRDALTGMLTAKGGLSADEIESKVQAIISLQFFLSFNLREPLPFGIVLSRHDIRPRYRPARVSPPSLFGILPEMYVALSHIQLPRMDFLRFYAYVPRLHMEQTFLESFGICLVLENLLLSFIANIYRLFRKLPDKWIEFHDCILQCKSASRWRTWTLKAVLLLLAILMFSFEPLTYSPTTEPTFESTSSGITFECVTAEAASNESFYACPAPTDFADHTPRPMGTWDSDSFPIALDTCGASRTLTPCLSDLIDAQPYQVSIDGIGSGSINHVGRVCWTIADDSGNLVTLEDDEAYCCPDVPYRLLCPHSWARTQDNRCFANGETEGDQASMMQMAPNGGDTLWFGIAVVLK
eukprot:scaffold3305_cov153-Cylindrotheca_fusiformis.AAC.2